MSHKITNQDLRIRRTHKLLHDALLALMSEKELETITVSEIVDRAMINRATFYRHYEDKYHLVRQCVRNVYAELQKDLVPISTYSQKPVIDSGLSAGLSLFKHVANYASFYRVMLGRKEVTGLEQLMITHFEVTVEQRLLASDYHQMQTIIPLDLFLRFTATAFLGVVQWWLEHEQPYSVEQMAHWFVQLVTPGASSLLGFADKPS